MHLIHQKVERERTQYRLMHEASLMLRSRPRKLTLWERLTGWGRPVQLAGPVTAEQAGIAPPEPNLNPDVPIALPADRDIHD